MSVNGTGSHSRGRRGVIALAVAFASAGAASGAALAVNNPYTVHVKVPSTVTQGTLFKVTAYGESANTSALAVFHDSQACGPTPAQEATHPHATIILHKDVTGAYSATKLVTATVVGTHYICAYLSALPPATLLRTKAFASYKTVP